MSTQLSGAGLGLTYRDSNLRSLSTDTAFNALSRNNVSQNNTVETVNEVITGTLTFGPEAMVIGFPGTACNGSRI